MGPYWPLCFDMGPFRSLCVLIFPFGPHGFYLVHLGHHRLFVFMEFNGS